MIKLNINNHTPQLLLLFALLFVFQSSLHGEQATYPTCQQSNSDSDGDGWGWENNTSCIVVSTPTQVNGYTSRPTPACVSSSSDSDGDGWGWENNASCIITKAAAGTLEDTSVPRCISTISDTDGDGWGYESGRSCLFQATKATKSIPNCEYVVHPGHQIGSEHGQPCKPYFETDITDLILVTGQSNVLGKGTTIDPSLDAEHPRVFAYTDSGWQIASLTQNWDIGAYRGTADPTKLKDREEHNNFALHFAKRLATLDTNRVIGIVLVSEPGEGISHWNPGATGMTRVQSKVISAINELPHKTSIDGLLWHQGETDWSFYGTADPDITTSVPSNYYPIKLTQLIANLRNENWYDNGKPFICGETIYAAGVNRHLNALNTDNDSMTACVGGYGLPATNSTGSHFNAASLRLLGGWYADRYYAMTK